MSSRDLSKDVLNTVKKKTGKSISEKDIQKIASGVNPSMLKNEAQFRNLIKQISRLVNVPVSESTMNEIIQAVRKSGLNPNNMQEIMKMMMGKK